MSQVEQDLEVTFEAFLPFGFLIFEHLHAIPLGHFSAPLLLIYGHVFAIFFVFSDFLLLQFGLFILV